MMDQAEMIQGVWDELTPAQQQALIVLADGRPHYCWKQASDALGQGGRGCVNARATNHLRTLHLARTISYGDAFTGDTVEITEIGQAVFDDGICPGVHLAAGQSATDQETR